MTSSIVDEQMITHKYEEGSINFISILRVLQRGKRTIATFALSMLLVAGAIAFLTPAQYTSQAAIIPPSSSSNSTSAALIGQLSSLGAGGILGGGAKSPGDLYVGILRSRSVEEEIVKRFHLQNVYKTRRASDAERILANSSQFEVDPKNSIIRISISDSSPSRARDMAQAYLDVLRSTNDRLAISDSSQRRLFFEQRLAKEKDDLEEAEVELRKTQERSGLIAPAGQTASEIQALAAIRAEIARREVELSGLRQYETDASADVIRFKSEIANLHEQLGRLQKGREASSQEAIPTSMLPGLQLDYIRREREVKYHESLFEILARQYEAARLDEAHDAPLLQVLDSPSYPEYKSSPHRMLIILVGGGLGFLTGCFWVLVRDYVRALRDSLAEGDPA